MHGSVQVCIQVTLTGWAAMLSRPRSHSHARRAARTNHARACVCCLCSPAITFELTSRLVFQTAETTTLYHACCYATVVVSKVYFILTEQPSLYPLHPPQKLAQPPY
jgi:hypothetical protein